jgi:hypothetical protein
MKMCRSSIFGALLMLLTGAAWSQGELVVYPKEGQSKEQQDKDNFECYGWAKGESGFDPMAVPTATAPPPQQQAPKGGVGRGALRGAAVGGIVDGSDGAKTGAAAGAVIGGARRSDQRRQQAAQQQQWEQQQAQQYQAGRSSYNRAYHECYRQVTCWPHCDAGNGFRVSDRYFKAVLVRFDASS